ncbi:hypothetical protein [Bacillus niameyensis]|uniref:hypothetical protein n=1 Tax=Bacillus niameyensis TaxID=1522308 RepID=UPI0007850FC7|nr:hypothetical protein [Bacillus niameyensis]
MSGSMLRYFAGGNTAKGFYNLYDSNLFGIERVLLLSGKSQSEKADVVQRLLNKWRDSEIAFEVIHNSANPEQLEGFIIRDLGFAIIDGDHPRVLGDYVGLEWETIDLDQLASIKQHENYEDDINDLKEKIANHYKKAYDAYETALRVHDDWEGIYIRQMDFDQANKVTNDLISKLFQEDEIQTDKESRILRRFLGAATPEGPVDFVDNITEGLTKRFFLKGRAGTGKSTLLKKVVAEAEKHRYDLEIYHCGFDPGSLDMVLVRELGWAVFDSTAPHEYFPSLPNDEVIDMYELTVAPGTDETYAEEIAVIEAKYREQMRLGKLHLAEVKKYQDELETVYAKITDRTHIETIYNELEQLLGQIIEEE